MNGFVYNDGGRAAAGYKGTAGDCVTRSIAVATGKPYQEVYDALNTLGARERKGKRKRGTSSARTGVYKQTFRKYLQSLGWQWHPTMFIGQGCRVHLTADELPKGRLIVCVSRHVTAMIDGVIHDTHDPRREIHWCAPGSNGRSDDPDARHWVTRRCVYGYFTAPEAA
jgi:hypothetical protein